MRVDLRLSAKQLNTLVFSFNALEKIPDSRDVKVARSILDKVVLKLRKKHLDVQSVHTTLFSKTPKKHKIPLEYHEAHYLEEFVTIMEDFPMNDYDRNVLRLIKSDLNQKLA